MLEYAKIMFLLHPASLSVHSRETKGQKYGDRVFEVSFLFFSYNSLSYFLIYRKKLLQFKYI